MTRKKIILLGLGGVVLLAVAGWNGYGWWLKHKLERYKAELAARGEKLTIADLVADRREPTNNGADIFLRSTALLRTSGLVTSNPPSAMRLIVPGRAIVGWRQPTLIENFGRYPFGNNPLTNTWEEFAGDLEQSREGINLLHEMIAQPNLDFHLNYAIGPSLMLPHLAPLKRAAQTLSYAALVDLHRGDAASAAQHIRAMLALARGSREESLLISQLVSLAISQIAVSTTWELLQSPNVTEADLKAIQADFAELDYRRAMEQAFHMERAMGGMTIRHYREKGGIFELGAIPGGGGAGATTTNFAEQFQEQTKRTFSPRELRKNSSELLWQSALSYEDELRHLQGMEVMVDGLRSATNRPWSDVIRDTTATIKAKGLLPEEGDATDILFGGGSDASLSAVRAMFAGVGSWSLKCLNKIELFEVNQALVTTAIALKRHELQHGASPTNLVALVPEFLAAMPRDPVDGQPLRYRLVTDRQWLLYSVAENAVDEGGNPRPKGEDDDSAHKSAIMLKGRDWVWPQPATVEDLQAWQEKQAKRE